MYVLCLDFDGPGMLWRLPNGRTLVGAGDDCDICMLPDLIDRHLFALECDDESVTVIALGPTRISVNRRYLPRGRERELQDGDAITFNGMKVVLYLQQHLSDPEHPMYMEGDTAEISREDYDAMVARSAGLGSDEA